MNRSGIHPPEPPGARSASRPAPAPPRKGRGLAFALGVALCLCGAAWADKAVLVVLPYVAEGHEGFSQQVRRGLSEGLASRYQFVLVQTMDVDAALRRGGFALEEDTPPVQISEALREHLGARFAVWGFARRAEPRGWVFGFRFLDAEEQPGELLWEMERHITQYRELPLLVRDVVDRIAGFELRIGLEPEVPPAHRVADPPNLLPNGDFEEGDETPAHWPRINNLTTYWSAQGNPGRCLMIDTDVLESQVLRWQEALAQGADFRRPPRKEPTKPPRYDTIAGTYGVHFPSDPVPVRRGVVYRLTADVKTSSDPKIFVKGYAPFDATRYDAQDREVYRMYLKCYNETKGREWEEFTRTFLPNAHYIVFDLENRAGTRHAAQATLALRGIMDKRGFPRIPREHRERILQETGFRSRFEMEIPEFIVNIRHRFLCAHAIYGKTERAEDGQGARLFLNLTSARIKQNIPLLEKEYDVTDDASVAAACADFLARVEARLPFVEYIRVIPYAYWRPGLYYFDNIVLTEEGESLWE